MIGRAKLTFDELLTLVTEVEAILNSRPLTYLSSTDMEEVLTPSHFLIGRRVLSIPDGAETDENDPEFDVSPSRSYTKDEPLEWAP